MEERMEEGKKQDFEAEKSHLQDCLNVIQRNIASYGNQLKETKAETKELYDNYRSGDSELHNELVIGLDWQNQLERTVYKNQLAVKKPYFGRIDYTEKEMQEGTIKILHNGLATGGRKEKEGYTDFRLYIGKNGIMKSPQEVLIVDWRAPVAGVYYDSDLGESSYDSPQGDSISITLKKKRTYEIEDGHLIDYYESDVIANDEFLTKYLAKNKEVVLGEIIATIQKEQNEIIRDTPWHSVIVQGVAGSGKTTVAMHRISYLLYNYKERLRQEEFYIIGSNKTLLNYITGVLPNLDVYFVKQMTMAEFFLGLLGRDFSIKKLKLADVLKEQNEAGYKQLKGSIQLVCLLEEFLKQYEYELISTENVEYQDRVIYRKEDILQLIQTFPMYPAQEKIDMLNKRVQRKIQMINEQEEQEKEVIREEVKKYKDYFGKKNKKLDLLGIYTKFLIRLAAGESEEKQAVSAAASVILKNIDRGQIDLYDLAMLTLIKKRLRSTDDFEFVSHIVVDEAQDFGVSIFSVLRRIFPEVNFTIMGDVSQNIYYDTGMNDWKTLRSEVFSEEKDRFYILAKSYRNTVEISKYAGAVLKKCSFETYEIEPIVRHGRPVGLYQENSVEAMIKRSYMLIEEWKQKNYDTTAIICSDLEEARQVADWLSTWIKIEPLPENAEEVKFVNGTMVLPVHLTKGLEFDTVLLWNPDTVHYPADDGTAKLLYVAITRALHECDIVYCGKLSELLTVNET